MSDCSSAQRSVPEPILKDGSDEPQVIDGPVVYTGHVVVSMKNGRSVTTEDGKVIFDSALHRKQIIKGPVTWAGGCTFEIG